MRTPFPHPKILTRNLQSSALTTLLASLLAPNNSTTSMADFTPIITPLPRSAYPIPITFVPADFRRRDESADTTFYTSPRFVQHIDENCIARLKTYYSAAIGRAGAERADGGRRARVLDLCSSWTSHFPDELLPLQKSDDTPEAQAWGEGASSRGMEGCVGVGMNEKELAANRHLTSYIVRDLNASPQLAEVADGSVDVAVCSVSIDYMTRPVELLAEVRRTLRVGGTVHCAFSNRCFPTKVVGRWLGMSEWERTRWVGSYFWADDDGMGGGGWEDVEEVVLNRGGYDDPLYVVKARKAGSESKEGKAEL